MKKKIIIPTGVNTNKVFLIVGIVHVYQITRTQDLAGEGKEID